MADNPDTKKYRVLSNLRHNGKRYAPNTRANVVELTEDDASPLLSTGAIDPKPIEPENKPKQ